MGLWLVFAPLAQAFAPPPAPQAPAPVVAPAPQPAPGAPVLVLNSLSGNVSVVDPKTWREVRRIPTGKEPHHLYLTPDEKSVIVANAMGDSLTFIDPRTAQVQRTVTGILDPYHLRFSPDMKWLVIAANRLDHVDIYRWNGHDLTLAKRIATGKTPSHLWIDSSSKTAWVTMQDSNELVAIDLATQTLRARVPTGPMPADVFGTPDDKHVLVALTGGDGVEVYDIASGTPRKVRTLTTGQGAHAFRALGDRRHVLVSNRAANTISLVNYQDWQVVRQFAAPAGPDCMEVMSDGKTLLVASRWAGRLTVIDIPSGKVQTQVRVGKSPHGVWTLDHVARQ